MNINDIIGSSKAFEPPFRVMPSNSDALTDYVILDANDTPFCWGLAMYIIADHICDLLNREHCGKGDGEKVEGGKV